MPLAKSTASGATPKVSAAKNLPVRPTPHWTSSNTSRIPWASQRRRRPWSQATGGTTYPPSPRTGSTTMAATSDGATTAARSWSSPARADATAAVWLRPPGGGTQ